MVLEVLKVLADGCLRSELLKLASVLKEKKGWFTHFVRWVDTLGSRNVLRTIRLDVAFEAMKALLEGDFHGRLSS